jgi:hypothetical protein
MHTRQMYTMAYFTFEDYSPLLHNQEIISSLIKNIYVYIMQFTSLKDDILLANQNITAKMYLLYSVIP